MVRRISQRIDSRIKPLREKLSRLLPRFNEKQRRLVAAVKAQHYGRGGISVVARVTGMSRPAIYRGLEELQSGVEASVETGRVSAAGGGRKRLSEHQPELKETLESLVQPAAPGDPERPLRWTTRGTRRLQAELEAAGYSASHRSVARLLHEMDYTLRGDRSSIGGEMPRWIEMRNFVISTIWL